MRQEVPEQEIDHDHRRHRRDLPVFLAEDHPEDFGRDQGFPRLQPPRDFIETTGDEGAKDRKSGTRGQGPPKLALRGHGPEDQPAAQHIDCRKHRPKQRRAAEILPPQRKRGAQVAGIDFVDLGCGGGMGDGHAQMLCGAQSVRQGVCEAALPVPDLTRNLKLHRRWCFLLPEAPDQVRGGFNLNRRRRNRRASCPRRSAPAWPT